MASQSDEPARFLDTGETIYHFGNRFFVRCPRCERRAVVAPSHPTDDARVRLFAPHRLVCGACGHMREWNGAPYALATDVTSGAITYPLAERRAHPRRSEGGGSLVIGGPFDWYFRLPVWLQTPCCGETLWAYNAEHLAFLRSFVTAQLRERTSTASTRSSASRLPHWMIIAKNRDEATRGLERLERLLVE
jgi:hypothetical protein